MTQDNDNLEHKTTQKFELTCMWPQNERMNAIHKYLN